MMARRLQQPQKPTVAMRVLAPGGRIVVLDSPIYLRSESGPAMVTARNAAGATSTYSAATAAAVAR